MAILEWLYFFSGEQLSISYEQIADQIIFNAKQGNQEALDFLQGTVAEQAEPAKPITTPIAGVGSDVGVGSASGEPEGSKTCGQVYPSMPQCQSLNGFRYSTRKQALAHLVGLRKEKPENYNKFCGAYGTHEKFYPNKSSSTPRGKYGASLSSCQCCQNSSVGAITQTRWRID